MKCIFEYLERSPDCTVVAFFFNARGNALEHSVEGCYRSLLLQILERIPRLRTSFQITNFPTEGQHWEAAVVRAHLREAVLHLQGQPLVLMIDALDECEPQEMRTLVYFLNSLAASTGPDSVSFNICLASRHYPNISIRLCENFILETHDAHTQDIYKYVQENLHVELETHRHTLLEPIMQRSRGVFMWIVLVIRRLNERFEEGATLQRLLSEIYALPGDLDALIQKIILDGASDPCLLPTLLYTLAPAPCQILSHARTEFCSAVLFAAGRLSSPHLQSCMVDLQDHHATQRFILQSSKGLVEVHGFVGDRANMHFIHESVRQHILNGGLAVLHPDLDHNVIPRSHMILADWCQDYLRCDFWTAMDLPIDQYSGATARSNLEVEAALNRKWTISDNPLLSYIDDETFNHLEAAYLGGALDLKRLRTFPLHRWINMANSRYDRSPRGRALFMSTASLVYVGLHRILDPDSHGIISGLLERHPMNPNVPEVALREEIDQEFSEMLFGSSLDQPCGRAFGTPLALAAHKGFSFFIDMLLDCGANVNVCGDGSALSLRPVEQASRDHNSVVTGFVDRETFALWASSPLTIACCEDYQLSAARALLTRGANINMYSGPWNNPLGTALNHNCLATAELLVDYGADVNLEDDRGFNIALRAAFRSHHFSYHFRTWGNDGILEMLFRRGAHDKLAALNVYFHEAAVLGRVVAIKLLVQAGADPQCKNKQGCTALYALAESSDTPFKTNTAAALLLDLGVDINTTGGQYDTALIAASFNGKAELVECLLEHGVDVRHKSREHGTALDVIRASQRYRYTQNQADIIYMLSEAGLE